MNDEEKQAVAAKQEIASKPSHVAYAIRTNEEGKAFFNRIGAVFEHKDGKGFTVDTFATPVNGRIVIRTVQERLDSLKRDEGKSQHSQEPER